MTILVTGATGNVGGSVLARLLEAGADVRATSRNPATLPEGVDARAADLDDPGTFRDALDGVGKVFLFPNPRGIEGFLEVAKDVEHIVLLSSLAAGRPEYGDSPPRMMHLVVEQAIERSGIPWTFVRPGGFATNTLQWAPSVRAEGVVRLPYPESAIAPVHEADIAEVAVEALLNDGHEGKQYVLTGPESITQRRQVELIGAAIGREVRLVELTREQARAEMLPRFSRFGGPELVETMLDMIAAFDGRPAEVADGFQQATGRELRSFEQWAVDHKADFS